MKIEARDTTGRNTVLFIRFDSDDTREELEHEFLQLSEGVIDSHACLDSDSNTINCHTIGTTSDNDEPLTFSLVTDLKYLLVSVKMYPHLFFIAERNIAITWKDYKRLSDDEKEEIYPEIIKETGGISLWRPLQSLCFILS